MITRGSLRYVNATTNNYTNYSIQFTTNLELLEIDGCSNIEHFNDDDDDDDDGELQLSTTLLQLTSLNALVIKNCDKLQLLPPTISSKLLFLEEI